MKRKEKSKLVVVFREPESAGESSKRITRHGRLAGGRIKDERQQRRITWPIVTAAVGAPGLAG